MTTKITGDNLVASSTMPAWDGTAMTGVAADVSNIENDLSTLALRQASNENKVAYNTNSMYIDVFQDSTGITGLTDVIRDASEYLSTISEGESAFTNDSNTILLLHMDGSDAGTTFTDSSSNNRTITKFGAPVTATSTKKYGTAAAFFGTGNNGLSIADNNDWNLMRLVANDFTIECWLNLTALPGSGNSTSEIWNHSTSDSTDVGGSTHFNIDPQGKMNLNVYQRNGSNQNDDFAIVSGTSVSLNTWTHVCLVKQSGTLRMYMNGVQENTQVLSGLSSQLTANNLDGSVHISKRSYNNNYGYIRGYMDEYRISNICRYPNGTTFTPNSNTVVNATGSFTSNTITAPSSITSMGAIITYQDNTGTNALNTDIIMKLSADDGVTYSTATLTAMPDFSTGIKMAKVNDLAVTAGVSLKYKVEFANQANGSKEARIRGVSLQY